MPEWNPPQRGPYGLVTDRDVVGHENPRALGEP
jgi:hypothetical protein